MFRLNVSWRNVPVATFEAYATAGVEPVMLEKPLDTNSDPVTVVAV